MASKLNGNDFTIFVGGLANNVTDGDLFNYFSTFGYILTCKAQMWHNNPQKCRGFALITAGDKQTYDIILSSQHQIAGRNIECKVHIKDKSQLNDYSKNESDRKKDGNRERIGKGKAPDRQATSEILSLSM